MRAASPWRWRRWRASACWPMPTACSHREAVATAAARDAENGRDFIAEAERHLGRADPRAVGRGGGPRRRRRRAGRHSRCRRPGRRSGRRQPRHGDGARRQDGRRRHAALRSPAADGSQQGQSRQGARHRRRRAARAGQAGTRCAAVRFMRWAAIWRSLARVDMDEMDYPLHVLHDYRIPAARALKLCRVVVGPVAGNRSTRSRSSRAAAPRRCPMARWCWNGC